MQKWAQKTLGLAVCNCYRNELLTGLPINHDIFFDNNQYCPIFNANNNCKEQLMSNIAIIELIVTIFPIFTQFDMFLLSAFSKNRVETIIATIVTFLLHNNCTQKFQYCPSLVCKIIFQTQVDTGTVRARYTILHGYMYVTHGHGQYEKSRGFCTQNTALLYISKFCELDSL